MGPVQPPQRKGRVPQYSRNQLVELQQKFDELEAIGVFKRPEDIGVSVEYVNPSFLVKKPNGSFRLVTAFADVGRYSKPQPSLMPDVDSTLRQIAQWKYIIATDLTKSFYQIPLSSDSMKYCGVVTPFKAGRESKETIKWSAELTDIFSQAQKALSTKRSIFLPQPNDQLWIVTDGSVKIGLGGIYITRDDCFRIFSATLRKRHLTWLQYEI
ncbi:unnamed protein product [Mytilus edulis]|uniref:Reverse transcriptase/retrotransposon-derived protein RNase H-like domain-containing protein n=1 Tax=Mytilus edulis TaxID=6550 RepID=A0A8S3RX88_MYTED|nr:unnamed protein product [Mytilus edulis]